MPEPTTPSQVQASERVEDAAGRPAEQDQNALSHDPAARYADSPSGSFALVGMALAALSGGVVGLIVGVIIGLGL